MNFETVIGIEIHCELKTKTKMFSSAPVIVGAQPNTAVNEIDLAHPGTLPSLNKEAVRLAILACSALNLKIDSLIRFDRKNYYYSDLPKGFQITQQFHPIGSRGHIDIETSQGIKHVRINRLHMEEDTAKQYHVEDESWIDFNRAGTPLVEIVSEADMRSAEEAMKYVETLRSILVYLEVTDGKMEEGSLRCDINISLREFGAEEYGVKTEIKNLNSISNIALAIDAEVKRQSALIEKGEAVIQATRRYDDVNKDTVLMRKKEGSVDYKYFPEPNIPPIQIDAKWMEDIISNCPELPAARKERYAQLGLSDYDSEQLILNKKLSDLFDRLSEYTTETKLAANYVLSEVPALMDVKALNENNFVLKLSEFGAMLNALGAKEISSKQAKEIFPQLILGKDYKAVVKEFKIEQVSDEATLSKLIEEVLDENPQSITDFHAGKDRAVGFLMGSIMKKTRGQANPAKTNAMLVEALKRRG